MSVPAARLTWIWRPIRSARAQPGGAGLCAPLQRRIRGWTRLRWQPRWQSAPSSYIISAHMQHARRDPKSNEARRRSAHMSRLIKSGSCQGRADNWWGDFKKEKHRWSELKTDKTAGWRVEQKVKEATYVALEGLTTVDALLRCHKSVPAQGF